MIINTSHDINNYIPQREPFVMVERLVAVNDTSFTSEFTIKKRNILCEEKFFSFVGLIENIAQTCAAGMHYMANTSGHAPKKGFIGSISKLKTYQKPIINSVIRTTVEIITQIDQIIVIKGANFLEGKKLLECEMKIIINE